MAIDSGAVLLFVLPNALSNASRMIHNSLRYRITIMHFVWLFCASLGRFIFRMHLHSMYQSVISLPTQIPLPFLCDKTCIPSEMSPLELAIYMYFFRKAPFKIAIYTYSFRKALLELVTPTIYMYFFRKAPFKIAIYTYSFRKALLELVTRTCFLLKGTIGTCNT